MAGQSLHGKSDETNINRTYPTGNGLKMTDRVPLARLQDNRMVIIGEEPKAHEELQDVSNVIEENHGSKKPVAKLSPGQLIELATSARLSPLSIHSNGINTDDFQGDDPRLIERTRKIDRWSTPERPDPTTMESNHIRKRSGSAVVSSATHNVDTRLAVLADLPTKESFLENRPLLASRTLSTPAMKRKTSNFKTSGQTSGSNTQAKLTKSLPAPLDLDGKKSSPKPPELDDGMPSPMPSSIPLPPLSFPTYVHLELSSERPSPLYIHRSATSDFPYESSRVKIERLLNFLFLPPQLEQVLWFGALACLDAWLYSFTILPLRFLKAIYLLSLSWSRNLETEAQFVGAFIYAGMGRVWRRSRTRLEMTPVKSTNTTNKSIAASSSASTLNPTLSPLQTEFPSSAGNQRTTALSHPEPPRKRRNSAIQEHRRTKLTPSTLLPDHKADILTGLLILFSCIILMYFDASMMYHSIRGQAAIKLYVIYNVLEVCYYL